MELYAGVALIVIGCAALSVEVPRVDRLIASFSASRGLHLSDVVGAAAVASGTALVWRGGRASYSGR